MSLHENMPATGEKTDAPQLGDAVITSPSVMFLRLTYWLNSTLTKSINVGMQALSKPDDFEPCVILANTERKVLRITRDEWNNMMFIMNDVSIDVDKKEKKTIFVPHEGDRNTIAITVRIMFGKLRVTLFKFEPESSPFCLTENEWYVLVNHTPIISAHLNQLENEKASVKERIRDRITSFTTQAEPAHAHDRLADEVAAFMRQTRSV